MEAGISGWGVDVADTRLIEGVLRRVITDSKIVIIAENWPCWLVSSIALRFQRYTTGILSLRIRLVLG